MSKFFNNPVVGIDISSDFSYAAILKPNGDSYRKPFRVEHSADGFNYLFEQIKKVEEEFSMKVPIFMESTGVYHLTLFHFLKMKGLNAFVINPLITNCNKNNDIRKVKNDKKDSLSIARIGKFENIKASASFDVPIFAIRNLCREYYNLTDSCSQYKNKLSADLRVIFPGYHKVFSDITGVTSIAILSSYLSPKALLDAPKEDVIKLIALSRRSLNWCNSIYNKLIDAAKEALIIGIASPLFIVKSAANVAIIKAIDSQINSLVDEIKNAINSEYISDSFRNNLNYISSIPGIGFITAVTILSEIGDINGFVKPKHLVAFFGIDPSVNQSGKFNSDKNKMSKRGTRFGRRALYAVALASVRKTRNGNPINSILLEYYQGNLAGKKKKVALVAVMHKIINYIFAVLRNQKVYEQRNPKLHAQMYLNNKLRDIA